MWQDRQDLGLTSILKTRRWRQQWRRAAFIEALAGLGARAPPVAPLIL